MFKPVKLFAFTKIVVEQLGDFVAGNLFVWAIKLKDKFGALVSR
jgi:hypothetical protein